MPAVVRIIVLQFTTISTEDRGQVRESGTDPWGPKLNSKAGQQCRGYSSPFLLGMEAKAELRKV